MIASALTIAGSDSGGGAGIQADLKTFSALGVYGASVITAITAQNTRAVTAVEPISDAIVAAQIEAVLSDIDIRAIKIGMLGAPGVIETVAEGIRGFAGPVVLDPVMVAKSGDRLLPESAEAALIRHLLPRADILTPNRPEAARLLGEPEAGDDDAALAQGQRLRTLGAKAVLMKGGHAQGGVCTDLLIGPDGVTRLDAPRLDTRNTHGTGCSLSSALAAGLAKGLSAEEAFAQAHDWLHGAIAAADALNVGSGYGPVHHFHRLWG